MDWSDIPVVNEFGDADDEFWFKSYEPQFSSAPLAPIVSRTPSKLSNRQGPPIVDPLDAGITSCPSDSDASTSEEQQDYKRSVSFSSRVDVRSHSLTVGDHPCCPDLCLSLDWDYTVETNRISTTAGTPQRLSYLERKIRLEEAGRVNTCTLGVDV